MSGHGACAEKVEGLSCRAYLQVQLTIEMRCEITCTTEQQIWKSVLYVQKFFRPMRPEQLLLELY